MHTNYAVDLTEVGYDIMGEANVYIKIWQAVLDRAARDYLGYLASVGTTARSVIMARVKQWIHDDTNNEPGSFLWVCSACGTDPSYFRAGLEKQKQAVVNGLLDYHGKRLSCSTSYISDRPCPHHGARVERYASNDKCVLCHRARNKALNLRKKQGEKQKTL